LVNPNFVQQHWSDEEERKLVLCMKVYREDDSSLVRVTNHFPDRAPKVIWDKWHRSLNPEFSQKPFTKKEDADLLAAVNRLGGVGNWTEIARLFPLRNSKNLYTRWLSLTNEATLIKKQSDTFKAKGACRVGVVGSGKLLSPDDFEVRIKRKKVIEVHAEKINEATEV